MKKINKNFFIKSDEIFEKTKNNLMYNNYSKQNLQNYINDTNNLNNSSNITTINNNNKYIFNILTKSPINTFLEISHESNNENNEFININENKENINTPNISLNNSKYKKHFNINKKIFNTIIKNKIGGKRNTFFNKSRNKIENKNQKIDKYKNNKNISFDLIKNEYRELKQKIFENKKNSKILKINKGNFQNCTIANEKKTNSNKNLLLTKFKTSNNCKILKSTSFLTNNNTKKLNYTSFLTKIKKKRIIKNVKTNFFSLKNYHQQQKINDNLNSHRRLNSNISKNQK